MRYFKRNPWTLPIIGGLITIISLFTPTTYDRNPGELILIWMNQMGVRILAGSPTPELWRSILWLNLFSFVIEVIIFASSIISVTLINTYRISSRSLQELKWKLLLSAVLIIISTLTWIIMMEVAYINSPRRHWEWYSPHFGVIGPFIGSGLIIAGVILAKDVGEKKESDVKPSMSYYKKTPMILAILGGIISIISLFTPTSFNRRYGTDLYYVWMNQLAIDIEPGPIELYLLESRTDIFLICFSIAILVIIFANAIILITLTNIYSKTSRSIQELKIKWLILAIIITAATLLWITYMEIFYSLSGASHWQNYNPHFGIIGPFIGSGLIIAAFFLAKDAEGRE